VAAKQHAHREPEFDAESDVPGDGHSQAAASPAVRRLARELGVDLARVRPTSPQGRITAEDVQAFVRQATHRAAEPTVPVERTAAARGEAGTDDFGAVRREKMSRIRQTIARNMMQSYVTIPQLTNFDDADVSQLEIVRQESKADYARSGIKLTALPFLIKAVASALRQHAVVNASLDVEAQEIIYKEYISIGIAVETERGLVVPVLRNVDQMAIAQIARELTTLVDRTRSGSYTLDDLRGGTFTISNLGSIGGTYSTPLINPPQVAILLAGRSRNVPVFVNDKIEPRLMLPLSLTYDHRVVDGAAAAMFLNDVKHYLEAPARLLLAP
jgi:pyruvate dehydrogenase E2 component (dihydrolipoamide acetyltransferase)